VCRRRFSSDAGVCQTPRWVLASRRFGGALSGEDDFSGELRRTGPQQSWRDGPFDFPDEALRTRAHRQPLMTEVTLVTNIRL